VNYRIVRSKSARKLRVRVGLDGIEVVQPSARKVGEVEAFLLSNGNWVLNQLERIKRFGGVRKPHRKRAGEILYRGTLASVHVEDIGGQKRANRVVFEGGRLVVSGGLRARESVMKSLENWLRRQAREEIHRQLNVICPKLHRLPKKVLVMGQRTKWGNCSAKQNLSFNWRLILAPNFVLRYLVTHEAVHLAVPDHSNRFWLTVHSLCPETERAKQWLCANGHKLMLNLAEACGKM
jgi:predicted metal-dependent hydrolase